MNKIYRYFLKHLKQNPKKICIDVDGKIFSFDQINQLVNQFEKYISLNIKKLVSYHQILNFIMFYFYYVQNKISYYLL